MPDVRTYLSNYPAVPSVNQAVFVARFIDEKPSTITIRDRNGSAVSGTQIVRIEPISNQAAEKMAANAVVEEEYVIVHGYRGHPTITATDLKRGDRFTVSDMDGSFEVVNIVEAFTDRLLALVRVK